MTTFRSYCFKERKMNDFRENTAPKDFMQYQHDSMPKEARLVNGKCVCGSRKAIVRASRAGV